MLAAFGLELFGAPHPIAESTWAKGAHPDVVALLRAAGPGRLCALFDIPDPTDEAWVALRRRFELHRDRGFWSGLSTADAERLVVFATDDRGAALACTAERFWLLGPRGEVFDAGASLAAVVTFLCRAIGRTYATQLDPRAPLRRADDGGPPFELDLGCQPVFVAAGAPGIDAYLQALKTGDDADALLEGAMISRPLLLSHRELLAALSGPRGDGIEVDARAEAIALVARIASRREHSFSTLLPPSFEAKRALNDAATRAWAAAPPLLSPLGPFALPDPAPAPEPIRIDLPMSLERYVPAQDAEAWIVAHAEAVRGSNAGLASALEAAAMDLPRSARAGFVRQAVQLDSVAILLANDDHGGLAWEQYPAARAAAAAGRLAERRAQGWPILALAVAGSSAELVRARGAAVLAGFEHALMPPLWLHAIASATSEAAFGADAQTFAERFVACASVTDALVDAWLPALRGGSGVAALLLSKRTDRDDVMRVLLEQLPDVLCALGWDGREPPERAPPSVTGPWVKGPLAPITRALVAVGDKRILDRLRAVARNRKASIEARTEAARGLLAAQAPGADAIVDEVEKAWERYWRI